MQLNNDGLMWALVKEKPEEGLWMKRVPIPEVGPNDVKIKSTRQRSVEQMYISTSGMTGHSIRSRSALQLVMSMLERS